MTEAELRRRVHAAIDASIAISRNSYATHEDGIEAAIKAGFDALTKYIVGIPTATPSE